MRGRTGVPIGPLAVTLLFALGIGWSAVRAEAAAPQETPLRPGLSRAVAQDLGGTTLEYVPGEARFQDVSVAGTVYSRISVGGAVITEAPGKPALPTATLHVA
ncbi:MAG TPA: hypothetical protein VFP58_00235, partial [Candidatus Eisenbacteria bacterium]|nr:hypothetical protein [Candidatus Eisenbacteria bacterium]